MYVNIINTLILIYFFFLTFTLPDSLYYSNNCSRSYKDPQKNQNLKDISIIVVDNKKKKFE